MIDIAAAVLVTTALLTYLNQRFLKLPMPVGVMASVLGVSVAMAAMGRTSFGAQWAERQRELVSSIDFSAALMQGMLCFLLFASASRRRHSIARA